MSYKSEKILIDNENMIVGQLENFEEASTLAIEPKDIINSNRLKKVCSFVLIFEHFFHYISTKIKHKKCACSIFCSKIMSQK